jgi:predicted unusual protein kinase regulating ubiquinone biosynthesis (AarF/ABC1/UbiB family)
MNVLNSALVAFGVALTILVVSEALVPSGSLPGPVYLARALRRQAGRTRRYAQITRILVRRGLLPYQRGGRRSELASAEGRARLARSLRLALEDGGVTFVKLGQVLDGRPLASVSAPPQTRAALAASLLDTLLRQVLLDGTFHADPHPGNVLLLDEARLERTLGRFAARHVAPGITPDVRMFTDLFRIVAEHGLAIPPEIAAVFRSLATMEGTLTQLDPGFDIVAEARQFASGQLAERLGPEELRRTAVDELAALLPMLRRLPRRVDRIGQALETGRLSVNVRLLADPSDRRFVTGLLHQVLLTFLAVRVLVLVFRPDRALPLSR